MAEDGKEKTGVFLPFKSFSCKEKRQIILKFFFPDVNLNNEEGIVFIS